MVTAIVAILATMLLPVFQRVRQKAKYIRWLGYKDNLRCDPSLVLYYTFEEPEDAAGNPNLMVKNMATAGVFSKSTMNGNYSDPEALDGALGGDISAPIWPPTRPLGNPHAPHYESTEGRWPEKSALYFDGDDYVFCRDDDCLDFTEAITIEVWFKETDYNFWRNYAARLVSKQWGGITSPFSCYQLGINFPWKEYFRFAVGGEFGLFDGWTKTPPQELDNWYHFVGTYDRKYTRMYVNGEKIWESTSHTDPIRTSDEPVVIGLGYYSGYGIGLFRFKGFIDEVAIYKRALTAIEIKGHYEMGKPLKGR